MKIIENSHADTSKGHMFNIWPGPRDEESANCSRDIRIEMNNSTKGK